MRVFTLWNCGSLMLALSSACAYELTQPDPPNPPVTGSLRVTAIIDGPTPLHAFSITLDREHSGPITANETKTLDGIPVGNHRVEIWAPEYCAAPNFNRADVTIAENQETELTMRFACTDGEGYF